MTGLISQIDQPFLFALFLLAFIYLAASFICDLGGAKRFDMWFGTTPPGMKMSRKQRLLIGYPLALFIFLMGILSAAF